jgi:hypothetical protein
MRPRWLRGWSWYVEPRSSTAPGDARPWWQRVAVIFGVKREW